MENCKRCNSTEKLSNGVCKNCGWVVVCAWCGSVIVNGKSTGCLLEPFQNIKGNVSHGMCEKCFKFEKQKLGV